jgi:hypothetical protein
MAYRFMSLRSRRLAEEGGFGNAEIHEGLEPKFGKIYCVKVERL